MKTIAINMQHTNWEDDGGDHDVFITQISDEDLAALDDVDVLGKSGEHRDLVDRIESGVIDSPTYPLTIDAAFSLWYDY